MVAWFESIISNSLVAEGEGAMRKVRFAALVVLVFLPGFLAGLFAQYPGGLAP
jgi:hypothetical protein